MAATAIIVSASYVNGRLMPGYTSTAFTGDATEYLDGTGAFSTPGGGVTPAALTRVDDTNVTLTLGGTPATALLQATSITVGWSGQLSAARGGTGLDGSAAANGSLLIGNGSGYTLATLTAGAGISVTNGAGSITLTNTFGGLIILRDNQSSGTNGGTFTSGSWQTRVLNTEATDTGGNCSLASNQFTLDAGTYEILASAPGYNCGLHQPRLQNITDGTTELTGTSEYSIENGTYSSQTRSWVVGRFTIASAKAFELQHRCGVTSTTYGFGVAGSFGTETYAWVVLRKVA